MMGSRLDRNRKAIAEASSIFLPYVPCIFVLDIPMPLRCRGSILYSELLVRWTIWGSLLFTSSMYQRSEQLRDQSDFPIRTDALTSGTRPNALVISILTAFDVLHFALHLNTFSLNLDSLWTVITSTHSYRRSQIWVSNVRCIKLISRVVPAHFFSRVIQVDR